MRAINCSPVLDRHSFWYLLNCQQGVNKAKWTQNAADMRKNLVLRNHLIFTYVRPKYIIVARASRREVSLLVAEKHWQPGTSNWRSTWIESTSFYLSFITFRSFQSKLASSIYYSLSSSAIITIWKKGTCSVQCSSAYKAQITLTSSKVSKHVNSMSKGRVFIFSIRVNPGCLKRTGGWAKKK